MADTDQPPKSIADLKQEFDDACAEETAYVQTLPSSLDIANDTADYTDEQRDKLARIRRRQQDLALELNQRRRTAS